MKYVKYFTINGINTTQVGCIELQGRPNAATEGAVGLLGIDVTSATHDVYKCVAVNGSIYTWELLSSGMSIISATISGGGVESLQFPYDNLLTPAMYVVKSGDLILDKNGYLYQIDSLNNTFCVANYCGTRIANDKSAYAYAQEGGYTGTEAEFSEKLAKEYLPLTGGTLQGDINLGGSRGLQGTTLSGGIFDIFRLLTPSRLQVGGTYPRLEFKGTNDRPTYNDGEMALLSDVATKDSPITVTSTDGEAYTATIEGITELKVGLSLTIIPDMTSTHPSPTLNINELGAISLKRRNIMQSNDYYSFTSASWFRRDYPIRVMYNGTYWLVESMPQPIATDLRGTVLVSLGGTGVSSYADTTYTTERYRATALMEEETNPTVNGVINWTYE
jgi:hypothetical protein